MRVPIFICICLLVGCPTANAQSGTVEIWIRAFIPDPANSGKAAGFITPTASGSIVRLLKVDSSWLNTCFATDNRGFSSDSLKSSRLETKFWLRLSPDGTASVSPTQTRTVAAVTSKIDCNTGQTLEQKQGSVDQDNIGTPAVAAGTVQVLGQIEGKNRLTFLKGLAPAIDYDFDVQWNPSQAKLTVSSSFGSFPAFEFYARQPNMGWTPVIQQLPTGTPYTLGGDAFGINTVRQSATVVLPGMSGSWTATSPDSRFSLVITGTTVSWIERAANGATLTRPATMVEQPDGSFRIERNNDAEVLAFLGFKPAIVSAILAHSPQPSFIIVSWNGTNLEGQWNGVLVIKDNNGNFKQLIQPGTRPAKIFVFNRTS